MNAKKHIIILLCFLLFGAGTAHSQETRTEFRIDFRAGSAVVEPDYSNNAQRLSEIIAFVDRINSDDAVEIVSVWFCGTSSPEGSAHLNRQLSQKRLASLEHIVRSKVEIPEQMISRQDSYIPWPDLKRWVLQSGMPHTADVIGILDRAPDTLGDTNEAAVEERIAELRRMDNGSVWRQMSTHYFSQMRFASVVIVTRRDESGPQPESAPEVSVISVPESAPQPEPEPEPAPEPSEGFVPHVYIKTNVLGWGLAMANLAAEVDLREHLSFALPIYYSGMNYFTYNLKFRIFSFQPELRAWLSGRNDGVFFGAHLGVAWYDFAFRGKYRYQDHDRHTPAVGGGVSVGYRMPISKNNRWKVEFTIGGGAYRLHYDTFINEPNGKQAGVFRKTYIGLDQAAVSFADTFDIKKGGTR